MEFINIALKENKKVNIEWGTMLKYAKQCLKYIHI